MQEQELRREIGEEKRRYGELLGVKGRLLREIGEEVRDKEGRVSKGGRECLEVQTRIKQLEERIKFKKQQLRSKLDLVDSRTIALQTQTAHLETA